MAQDLNVREGPSSSSNPLKDSNGYAIQLTPGMKVRILEENSGGSGYSKIRFDFRGQTGLVGYVLKDYVLTYADLVLEDPEYLAYIDYLKSEGFPESYWESLAILHQQHPNWVFKAMKTGLAWGDALYAEYASSKSLINKSSPSSWKSTEQGNYLWMDANGNDGEFVRYDGGNWNAASKEIVAYCLDPRNFLCEKAIFMFEKQSFDPNLHTIEGVTSMLKGSHMDGAVEGTTYAEILMEAAVTSGVSPYFLAARIFQEVGVTPGHTSSIISGSSGYYNYYNFGAYGSNPVSAGIKFAKQKETIFTINGNKVSDLRPWNTRKKAIIGGAVQLGAGYVSAGQDSLYLQRFNVTTTNTYGHQYMTNVLAPCKEVDLYYDNLTEGNPTILDTPFVFNIPVYTGMPAEKCERPIGDGNPNGFLKELSVADEDMTPDFDYQTFSYDMIVGPGTSSITITAKAIASTTTVTGAGKVNLAYGENTINIDSKAQNGIVKRYVLHVFRKETTESIVSTAYEISDKKILGVSLGTEVATFLSNVTVTGSSKTEVLDLSGAPVTSGKVGTGFCLKTDDFKIPIVIYGDVTGDGGIDAKDLLYIKRHILGISKLGNAASMAADVKGNDGITAVDLLYVKRHMLGISTIVQPSPGKN